MPISSNKVTIDLDAVEQSSSRGHALDFPRTAVSDAIEAALKFLSGFINWIWILLVLVIVVNVVMRYALGVNYVWVEELQWHMYAVGFMIGIGYAVMHDAHVRVDVLANGFSRRTRAVIELLGIVLILLPLAYIIVSYAIPFVERAYIRNEGSSAPGGINHRWVIKSVIIVAFVYLGLAAFARLTRVSAFLFGFPRARATAQDR